jgi:amylosucrase
MLFNERFAIYEKELNKLYYSLYGNTDGFDNFKDILQNRYFQRDNSLKSLDKERLKNPTWYLSNKMLGMSMYTELFGQSLKGLESKLYYLSNLGITYLHLMPLLKMPHPNNDGGYAVDSFVEIDSKFGSNDDLVNLTKAMRKRGMSLCMDFVMNHSSDTHSWALKAKEGDKDYQDRYFFYEDRKSPDEYDSITPQVFPSSAPGNFTFNKETGKWVLTSFYPFQWDLNYSNHKVLIDIVDSMLSLANLGVEIFRLDAVPYIWKQLGTSSRNLPQVHIIVRMIRIAMEIVCPAVILKGEVVMAPKELEAYFGTPEHPECHLLYNAATMANFWDSLASQDTRLLTSQVNSILSLPSHCHFLNYLRCHDDVGWAMDDNVERQLGIDPLEHKKFVYHFFEGTFPGSYSRGALYNYDPITEDARSCGTAASFCGIEEALKQNNKLKMYNAIQRDLLLHATMFSIDGFPLLSSGDEIAQLNDYSYMSDPDRKDDSRNLHRSKFNWDNAKKINTEGTYQERIYNGIEKLLKVRSFSSCFDKDSYVTTWNTSNDKTFLIRRTYLDEELLCFSSFSDEEETLRTNCLIGTYKDLFTGREIVPGWGFTMIPHEYLWCKKISD